MKLEDSRSKERQYLSLKGQASNLLNLISQTDVLNVKYSGNDYIDTNKRKHLRDLLDRYKTEADEIRKYFNKSLTLLKGVELNIQAISSVGSSSGWLREVIVGCEQIIGYSEHVEGSLSEDEHDKLTKTTTEAEKICEDMDLHFGKNLKLSIASVEQGDFLGAALILGRVIDYGLVQIKIEGDINSKVAELAKTGAIERSNADAEELIIKTIKKSRNYFTHRIDTYPDSYEAISLLGDCLTFLKALKKFISTLN